MATAAIGTVVKIYMDTPIELDVGDVIGTPTGRRYGVVGVRRQTRGKRRGRQHLQVLVLDPQEAGPMRLLLRWYKRGR